MTQITIQGIKDILNDQDTIFMKQGKGGKKVHLSVGACRENNLLCGVTYSRNGNRSSYLFKLHFNQVETDLMCKDCLAIVHEKVQPVAKAGA